MTDDELRAAVDRMVDERQAALAQARADANLFNTVRAADPGEWIHRLSPSEPEESQRNADPE